VPDLVPIRRALVSVSNKQGLEALAQKLKQLGVEVLSTGGTAKAMRQLGLNVTEVSDYTGAPEILDGRVKTLHPKIHGGLLGRPTAEHQAEMGKHGIGPIDLLVVNLYPFRETIAKPGVKFEDAIENIDIGGPSMLRSAAKNHERVTVVVDPADYAAVLDELEQNAGATSAALRFRLARKVFATTAAYDGAIANFLNALDAPEGALADFPSTLSLQWSDGRTLRYGENPHQKAAFYLEEAAGPSVGRSEILQGKELSYNNLLDLDAALQLVLEFERPTVAIIKHTNPCGVAESDEGCGRAYALARECDPVSAFGGIVACNRVVDHELGRELSETFLECVIAPGFSDGARSALERKKSLRLLQYAEGTQKVGSFSYRSIAGGLLVQTRDLQLVAAREAEVASKRPPSPSELTALDFAWRVCKHVKSNAIVLAKSEGEAVRTVGIGAGQMSRVDSVKLSKQKAQIPTEGAVLASDAFFPFRDGVDSAAASGVTAIMQPGGSVRDDEVIAAANEHGMTMLFTRMRHFRH
jgi:phosphoribosylaminoimidazolecarboxamide formyltransferase/IMP cyclohydrolase